MEATTVIDPTIPVEPLGCEAEHEAARFWSRVDRSGECWTWIPKPGTDGYGRSCIRGQFRELGRRNKYEMAHRKAYELAGGVIPDGYQIDHLCQNRKCVRPSHLEAVTPAENHRRADPARFQRIKTECRNGHPYDEANTRRDGTTGWRYCRTCHRLSEAARRTRRLAA